jgi:dihydroorotase
MPETRIVELLSTNARRIFNLPGAEIRVNNKAQLTIFNPAGKLTLTTNNIRSKSKNSAFIGVNLEGAVIGIVNKDQIITSN